MYKVHFPPPGAAVCQPDLALLTGQGEAESARALDSALGTSMPLLPPGHILTVSWRRSARLQSRKVWWSPWTLDPRAPCGAATNCRSTRWWRLGEGV